ncbi:hypothetical protein [Streptomyces sp. NPDC053560]|uniref:hypothetical protein n=1 Tax=Streptomyces sp. NPDC053560 TaxID=3365711 RepID=UPI0037CE22EE
MRKFKRAAVLGASVLAFSGFGIGAAQAAEHSFETQGNASTDCITKETQKAADEAAGHHVKVTHCERMPQDPGNTSMLVFYQA